MNSNDFITFNLKIVLFILMLLVFFGQPVYAIVKINVLYNENITSSRLFKEQLTKAFILYDIKYQLFNLDQVKKIQDKLPADKQFSDDMVFITLGSKALKTAWEQIMDKKIFSLLVSQDKIKKIIEGRSHDNKLYGLYQEQSLKHQLLLAQQLLPGIRSIGFLTTPHNLNELLKQIKRSDFEVGYEVQTVSDQTSLGRAISYIIQNTDLLITLAEPEIYNRSSLKNILLTSYRNNVPLLGINKAFVDAGCLAAVYTTPEQFSRETVEIFNSLGQGKELPKINYSKYFSISVNHNVATSLGLYIHSEKELLSRMAQND